MGDEPNLPVRAGGFQLPAGCQPPAGGRPGKAGDDPEEGVGLPRLPPARRRRLAFLVGVAIGAGAVYTAVSNAGGAAEALHRVATALPGWLGAGLVAEALSFFALGGVVRLLAGGAAAPATALQAGLVVGGLGAVLPAAPAEGVVMASRELRRRGAPARSAFLGVVLAEWYVGATALGLVAGNAVLLSLVVQTHLGGQRLSQVWLVGAPAVAVLAVLALSTWLAHRRRTAEWVALVAGRVRFWRRLPAAQLRAQGAAWWTEMEAVLGPPPRRRVAALLALLESALDAVCFGASLAAAGIDLRPGVVLVCYGVIVVATMVPFLPAGLGAVETVVPALLHHLKVPLASGLAGVLVYRGLSTFLPAVAGALAYLHLRLARQPAAPHPAAPHPAAPHPAAPHPAAPHPAAPHPAAPHPAAPHPAAPHPAGGGPAGGHPAAGP